MARLDETDLSAFIAKGMRTARGYGFVTAEDICQYIDLMCALGPDFDRDPAISWARDLLTDPGIAEPAVRMDLLVDAAHDHQQHMPIR